MVLVVIAVVLVDCIMRLRQVRRRLPRALRRRVPTPAHEIVESTAYVAHALDGLDLVLPLTPAAICRLSCAGGSGCVGGGCGSLVVAAIIGVAAIVAVVVLHLTHLLLIVRLGVILLTVVVGINLVVVGFSSILVLGGNMVRVALIAAATAAASLQCCSMIDLAPFLRLGILLATRWCLPRRPTRRSASDTKRLSRAGLVICSPSLEGEAGSISSG